MEFEDGLRKLDLLRVHWISCGAVDTVGLLVKGGTSV